MRWPRADQRTPVESPSLIAALWPANGRDGIGWRHR
jgi:hypothetical protein